jgi:HEAT repeat protein
MGEKGAKAFLLILRKNKKESVTRLTNELTVLNEAEPWVRKELYTLVKSTNVAEIMTAVTGLGQVSYPEDAQAIEPLLTHEKALVREATAVALARLGEAGVPALTRAMSSTDPRTRSLVMASVPHSLTEKSWALLLAGLKDPDTNVCLTAFSTIGNLPLPLQKHRKEVLTHARERLKTETDPNVRLTLQLLK